jgi:hypothetical protein
MTSPHVNPSIPPNRHLAAVLCWAVLSAAPASLVAQKIESAVWGFDGTSVVVGRFNPLTVVVSNSGSAPLDDTLYLLESNGFRDVGAPLAERVYLAPGAQRAVQFNPYIATDGTWSLRWGGARIGARVEPQPNLAWPKPVALAADSARLGQQGDFSLFPAAWFPVTPGAAEALTDLVLDHDPQWDEPRARALLAWVRGGGRLHLAPNTAGAPVLSAPLDVLNDPRRSFALGAGRVDRLDKPLARLRVVDLERGPQPPPLRPPPHQSQAPEILSALQLSLLPEHDWALIFLAAVLFVVCIGPGHWLLARRRVDWRLSLLYLLGTIALFTLVFGYLGARGYDEVSAVCTVAHARSCGDGEVVVTQFSNAFVTSGGRRRIKPSAAASVIGTAQTQESVDGMIDSGVDASLTVDMAMFSARGFVHRGHYQVGAVPRIEQGSDGLLRVLDLEGSILDGLVFRGGKLFDLRIDSERVLNVLEEVDRQRLHMRNMPTAYSPPAGDGSHVARRVLLDVVRERLLMGADLTLPFDTRPRVFVLMRSPAALHLARDSGLGREQSHVVYEFDLDR